MDCPSHCNNSRIAKRGFYLRPSDLKPVQRFRCLTCRRSFSTQTYAVSYRQRKRYFNQLLFRLLAKGNSQRGCAMLLGIHQVTVARRLIRFGMLAKAHLRSYRRTRLKVHKLLIDEMESFEHSKCKPLTLPIAVEKSTRKILAVAVAPIAAKGHLADIAKKKYGHRRCGRAKALHHMLLDLKDCCVPDSIIESDESCHYPKKIKSHFPLATHRTVKGRRGCVVGQGELKNGGFDPMFSLNHTYAMIRDNIKRLTRRTWCTTKRPDRLEMLLNIYAWFHNLSIDAKKRRVYLRNLPYPIT